MTDLQILVRQTSNPSILKMQQRLHDEVVSLGKQALEWKANCEALQLALEVERDAANLYAKQVAHWIEKHDALLDQQLAAEDRAQRDADPLAELRAYELTVANLREQLALIDLEGCGCRGGFSTGELDEFIPGWRDKVSEIGKLRAGPCPASRPPCRGVGNSDALAQVAAERKRQDAKWGGPKHDDTHQLSDWCWFIRNKLYRVVTEHGERACDDKDARGRLIEISALAVAAVESMDRHKPTPEYKP